jgi:hypothetical protein
MQTPHPPFWLFSSSIALPARTHGTTDIREHARQIKSESVAMHADEVCSWRRTPRSREVTDRQERGVPVHRRAGGHHDLSPQVGRRPAKIEDPPVPLHRMISPAAFFPPRPAGGPASSRRAEESPISGRRARAAVTLLMPQKAAAAITRSPCRRSQHSGAQHTPNFS